MRTDALTGMRSLRRSCYDIAEEKGTSGNLEDGSGLSKGRKYPAMSRDSLLKKVQMGAKVIVTVVWGDLWRDVAFQGRRMYSTRKKSRENGQK